MVKNRLMLPLLAAIVGVAASAFTVVGTKTNVTRAGTYWYSYKLDAPQTAQARQNGANYINPSTLEPGCSGSVNECAVEVTVPSGTPPADISTLSITFDQSSGMPEGGDNFLENATKD